MTMKTAREISNELIVPLAIGSKTPYGTIQAVGTTGGERYYWIVERNGHPMVSMMPASVIESAAKRHNAP